MSHFHKNLYRTGLMLFVCCLVPQLMPLAGHAEQVPQYVSSVQLDITAQPELKVAVERAFKKAFEAIPDVIVVQDNPNWLFSFIATSETPLAESLTLSVVLTLPFRGESLKFLVQTFKPGQETVFDEWVNDLYRFHGHWIYHEQVGDLERLALEIVQSFDERNLSKTREYFEKMKTAQKALAAIQSASSEVNFKDAEKEKNVNEFVPGAIGDGSVIAGGSE